MLLSSSIRFLSIMIFLTGFSTVVWACDSCSITRAGRDGAPGITSSEDGAWFSQYMYENQNWHEKEAAEAHRLHHQGHDFHDKTTEDFHHLTIRKARLKQGSAWMLICSMNKGIKMTEKLLKTAAV